MMNCNDIVIKLLGKLEGENALVSSQVCSEWKILLEKKTEKYLIKLYLEKLEKLVEQYSHSEVYIILGNRPKAELLQKKNDAEKAVNDFFEQRNKNYNKKLYIKAIKETVRCDLFTYMQSYRMKEYANWFFSQSFVKKFNELKKQL